MQKRGYQVLALVLVSVLFLSLALVSAFSFSDFFKSLFGGKVTGNVISASSCASGLLAYYSLNTTDSSSIIGDVGSAKFVNAKLIDGKIGKAIDFNGENAYVDLGKSPAITGTGPFSISLWVKKPIRGGDNTLIQQRSAESGGVNGEYQLELWGDGRMHFWTYGSGKYGFDFTTLLRSSLPLDDRNWHHVIALRNSSGAGKIFIDGRLVASKTSNIKTNLKSIKVYLGADKRDNVGFFKGSIDEVSIWNKELSQAEIDSLYNSGTGKSACKITRLVCAQDVQTCSDGSTVQRNPDNNCELDSCPLTPQSLCTDSDGGNNPNVEGRVVAGSSSGNDCCALVTTTDPRPLCSSTGNSVWEYTCDINNAPLGFLIPCTNGCSNGACLPTLPSTCTENWVCSPRWSSCLNGQQTKTCRDRNSCGTTTNKPATTQSCTTNEERNSIIVHNTQEFKEAIKNLRQGTKDTILLAPGTYSGGIEIANIRGAEDKPIIIAAQNSSNKPLIQGGSEGMKIHDIAWLEIYNIKFKGFEKDGVDSWATRNLVLSGLEINSSGINANYDGIRVNDARNFRVENNVIENWGYGGEGIDSVYSKDGIVENNTLRHNNKGHAGMQFKGGAENIIVRGNVFRDIGNASAGAGGGSVNIGGGSDWASNWDAITPNYEAKNIVVERNIFIGGKLPIAFEGAINSKARYNTIYLPKYASLRIVPGTQYKTGTPFRNSPDSGNGEFTDNIIVFTNPSTVKVTSDKANTFIFARNLWYNNAGGSSNPRGLPVSETSGVYGVNPEFINAPEDMHPGNQRAQLYGAYAPDSNI